ncbi:MAG: PAS domain-containing protein [Pseudomonadota bacterium]
MISSTLHITADVEQRASQDLSEVMPEAGDLLDALASFDRYGLWRFDIQKGLVYWSRDVYLIHGLEPKQGPVDIQKALNAYHLDDRAAVANCLEEAIRKKTGFRFVLRIQVGLSDVKLVKSTGIFRTTSDGREELFGSFSEFQTPIRTVAIGV